MILVCLPLKMTKSRTDMFVKRKLFRFAEHSLLDVDVAGGPCRG